MSKEASFPETPIMSALLHFVLIANAHSEFPEDESKANEVRTAKECLLKVEKEVEKATDKIDRWRKDRFIRTVANEMLNDETVQGYFSKLPRSVKSQKKRARECGILERLQEICRLKEPPPFEVLEGGLEGGLQRSVERVVGKLFDRSGDAVRKIRLGHSKPGTPFRGVSRLFDPNEYNLETVRLILGIDEKAMVTMAKDYLE